MVLSAAEILLGFVVVVLLALLGLRARVIDKGGFFAGVIVGSMILTAGGWSWFVTILIFFVTSALFTKYKYAYKRSLGTAQEKGGVRGWPNIIANGAFASLAALGEFFSPGIVFAGAFLGAVSTATADTLATEVGLLSRSSPRLITSLRKRVPHGTSGGVTGLGELASLLSCALIAALSAGLGVIPGSLPRIVGVSLVSGMLGSTTDSILGATIQGLNRCQVCDETTENLRHHGKATKTIRGFRILDNNVVNLVSTGVGAVLGALFFELV